MNFNLPTTLGDWFVILAAVLITHFFFVWGLHAGWWHSDAGGHVQFGG